MFERKGDDVSTWLVILAAGGVFGQAEYEKDGVRLVVRVVSNVYHWEITNVSAAPVKQFEVRHHNCYLFKIPDGWEKELDGPIFRTWTDDPANTIRPGQTKKYSFRVTSQGAIIGEVPAQFTLDSGQVVRMAAVWGPVPLPRSGAYWVAGGIVVILLGHTWLVSRRERRGREASSA